MVGERRVGMSVTDDVHDVVRIDSDTGELVVQTPHSDVFNSTLNVTARCFSEWVRGTRESDSLAECIQYTLSFFSLEGLRFYLFPLRVQLPWETAAEAGVSSTASAASADEAPGGASLHVDADHHHYADPYYATGLDLVFFFVFLSLILLICGATFGDFYVQDAGEGTEWRYRNGRYLKVAAPAAAAASLPPPVAPPRPSRQEFDL